METIPKKTQNRRAVLIMAVITIVGYVVWVATYQPTPFSRFQAVDPRGASACQGLEHWLEDPAGRHPVARMELIGLNASFAETPSIKETAGLIEDDVRFAAYRAPEIVEQYRFYGYGPGHDYADDLAALDRACLAQGLEMPAYQRLM